MKFNNSDIIIWVFIILLIAFIFGLYNAENHRIPNTLYMKTRGSTTPYLEHFESNSNEHKENYSQSSLFDVSGGASSKYGWGISSYENDYLRKELNNVDENIEEEKRIEEEKKEFCKKPENKNVPKCFQDDSFYSKSEFCKKCNILDYPDIDKYVLKSSVPPCPNLSDYIKKSEIPPCKNDNIDLNDYVKKSEIPVCKNDNIDLNDYVKKNDIPKCPTCPTLPDMKQPNITNNIKEFKIVDVKDVEMLLQDKRIREYLDANYEKKNNIPKQNNSQNSQNSILGIHPPEKNNSYVTSSSLWNEIKSFFGFGSQESITQEESTKYQESKKNSFIPQEESRKVIQEESKKVIQEESRKQVQEESRKQIYEEENKMIYNQTIGYQKQLELNESTSYLNNQMLKPLVSNADAQYAGDKLYATV